jgi:hypothetical protein
MQFNKRELPSTAEDYNTRITQDTTEDLCDKNTVCFVCCLTTYYQLTNLFSVK